MNDERIKFFFNPRLARALVDGAVLAAIAATLWVRIEVTPFHIDEVAWIGYGYYYHLLFEKADIDNPDWKTLTARRDFPVGKYMYGLGLALQGHPIRDLKVYKTFSSLWMKPRKLVTSIPLELLFAARRVAWFFSTLALWLIYILTRRAAGMIAGAAAALLLLLNPVSVVFTKALADPMLLACLAGGGLIVSMWRRGPERLPTWRIWAIALSAGLLTGIAAGVKANGAILGIYLALAVIWIAARKQTRPESLIHLIGALFLAGLVALVVFIGVNPTMYDYPALEVMHFMAFKKKAIAEQQALIGPAIHGPSAKLSIMAIRVLILGPYVPFRFAGILSLAGLVLLIRRAFKNPRGGEVLLILWCFVLYASITAWIPLDWERYYLPAATAATVLAGVAIGVSLESLLKFLKPRKKTG